MPRAVAGLAVAAALASAALAVVRPDDARARSCSVAGALIVAGAAWLESAAGLEQGVGADRDAGRRGGCGACSSPPIPNVQPVTVIAVVAGVALGPARGRRTGALAALVSNFYLGQGAYTPWQMLAWGPAASLGGLSCAAPAPADPAAR